MAFCPNCGTQYEALPLRCQCGCLFGSAQPEAAPTAPSGPARFEFDGDGGALAMMYLKTILLSFVTLGIYSFWGRTAIRRYLWSKVRFLGQPFSYHGTGKELLLGWFKFFGLIAALYAVGILGVFYFPKIGPELTILFVPALLCLVPVAIHGALRYRYSRTSWQGRRFSYRGNLFELMKIFWLGALLTAITLSIYLPYFLNDLRKCIVNNSWYGAQRFEFTGEGRDLRWPYIKFLLLFFPTLTLYRFWFQGEQTRYYWSKTKFGSAAFESGVSGDGLFFLTLTNWLLITFTLGIAYPWAVCRQFRYTLENLRMTALPNIVADGTAINGGDAFGDVLAAALGTDAGIDAGFGL